MMNTDNFNRELLNSPLNILNGIGPQKVKLFKKLNVNSILDLLYFFPRNYEDRTVIKKIRSCSHGEYCCIKVFPVRRIVEKRIKSKLSLFLMYAADDKDTITVKWFSAPFCKKNIKPKTEYIIYGKFISTVSGYEFEMKYMEPIDEMKYTGTIVPVYHTTNGLTSKNISDAIWQLFEKKISVNECFPDWFLKEHNLCNVNSALYSMHCPQKMIDIETARRRLVFEELFIMQLALLKIKNERNQKKAVVISAKDFFVEYSCTLPFELTSGQKKVINDICLDLKRGKPMNRLIQGDVGCGKTVVAAAAMYAVCKNGYQSVFMAPTEILASQHYNTLSGILGNDFKIALLTSSVKNKNNIINDIKSGTYDIVIGTHAILEENVQFKKLALVITDEQHRFGVNQKAVLASKADDVHVIVMSATPIPRTLSLILYGDMDVSIIDTLPGGRQKTETFHINSNLRERAYKFICNQIVMNKQAYVVCPLVEESDSIDAASVTEVYDELKTSYLKDVRTGFIHGKMKSADKDIIMDRFKKGDIDVLISTTVIEVGVDVPDSTVMLIENAERFGLSQLHQLRGRVGRGKDKSYCILISDSKSEYTLERMKIMVETNDGFEISAKDLELRGGGEFFGTRQHGLPELKVANLFTDISILKEAQNAIKLLPKNFNEVSDNDWNFIKTRISNLFSEIDNTNIFN